MTVVWTAFVWLIAANLLIIAILIAATIYQTIAARIWDARRNRTRLTTDEWSNQLALETITRLRDEAERGQAS